MTNDDQPKRGRLVQLCKGIKIQASQNKSADQTGVFFDTEWGEIGVVMDSGQLSLLISMIIEHANKHAEKKAGSHDVTLSFDPLPAQAIGFAPGPTLDTTYVSMLMDKVNITFAVKKSALQATYAAMARET